MKNFKAVIFFVMMISVLVDEILASGGPEQLSSRNGNSGAVVGRRITSTVTVSSRAGQQNFSQQQIAGGIERTSESMQSARNQVVQPTLEDFVKAFEKTDNCLQTFINSASNPQPYLNLKRKLHVAAQGFCKQNFDDDTLKYTAAGVVRAIMQTGSTYNHVAPVQKLQRIAIVLADGYEIPMSRSASPSSSSDSDGLD